MNLKYASSEGKQHQILLSPESTAIVIVDHQVAFEQCFGSEEIRAVENGVASLVRVAEKLNVPVIASLVETNRINSKLSSKLDNIIPALTRFSRNGVNPWDDPAFTNAVQIADRPRLLITGLSAEISLSFTALCALERGFEVYVVKDTCLGYSEKSIATSIDRLIQAGVIPVSWRQVVLEWSYGTVDEAMLRRILKAHRKLKPKKNMP